MHFVIIKKKLGLSPEIRSRVSMSGEGVDLQVLYDVGPCLVVNKPSGIATQAPPGLDSMEVRVRDFYRRREQKSGNFYLGIPHRLDRPTSGALIFARHVRAARRIAAQFAGRTITKTYWVLVEGHVAPAEGIWRDDLVKLPERAHVRVTSRDDPAAKEALLRYRVLWVGTGLTHLEVVLETGRTHQVRVQAATRGHPVLGDLQYGAGRPFGVNCTDERERAIALHARRIIFQHPTLTERVDVTAPLPAAWQDFRESD